MSIKWIGIYAGFFLLMLMVALFVTGVFQHQILPRLHGQSGGETAKAERPQEPSQVAAQAKAAPADEPNKAEPAKPNEQPGAAKASPAPQAVPAAEPVPVPKPAKESAPDKQSQVKRLARMYEGMRPKEAAIVLEKLDRPLAAGVLLEIKDRQAAKILGVMSPGTAAELSRMLSQAATGETQ
jgi:hypothetical protein